MKSPELATQQPPCKPRATDSPRIMVPHDPLATVFTARVREVWAASNDAEGSLAWRLDILSAFGPYPNDPDLARTIRLRRATKAAWATYLEAAYACGFFEGDRGTELMARLRGTDDDGFRSAFSECLSCWFLAGKMGFKVDANAPGRNRRQLDMRVHLPDAIVGVEVKAPFRGPIPPGTATWGDDADKITQCLEAANRQFDDSSPNILVIAPQLRLPLHRKRNDLVKAAYGETVIAFDVNASEGRLENHRWQFSPQGKFLGTMRPGGKPLKPDGFPAYRRVSAIICIETRVVEKYADPAHVALLAGLVKTGRSELFRMYDETRRAYNSRANEAWVDHDVLVLHNPYAYHAIRTDVWSDFPQLICDERGMHWTDGHDVSFG